MFNLIFAILMGLACPSHSNSGSNNGTTVSAYDDGDGGTVTGDAGHIPPKKP